MGFMYFIVSCHCFRGFFFFFFALELKPKTFSIYEALCGKSFFVTFCLLLIRMEKSVACISFLSQFSEHAAGVWQLQAPHASLSWKIPQTVSVFEPLGRVD
jgi:hypothetical protein